VRPQPWDGGAAEHFAAIDLGTNNCRLLVARPAPDGFRVIDSFSRVVRLGEGLGGSGRLSEPAMARAVEALRVCAAKLRRNRVSQVRAVATEACRRALNRQAFLERVQRETGLRLEVIGQEEEASLALYGCAPLLDPAVPNALVFDIGGGSTEVSWMNVEGREGDGPFGWAERPRLVAWHSMPIGVAGLAERHGAAEPSAETYRAMVEESLAALADFAARPEIAGRLAEIRDLEAGAVQMLGTSGTVTTLAGVHQELPRYDRRRVDGCCLSFETVRRVSHRIAAMSHRERVRHPCIGSERADFVIAGCAILEAICRTWPVGSLRVADRGLREGILYHLMRRPSAPPRSAAVAGRPV
jgi:exopolyphosphatase/guanosine-5'-triphosphate,3'-diphosphate pyrophosphatase